MTVCTLSHFVTWTSSLTPVDVVKTRVQLDPVKVRTDRLQCLTFELVRQSGKTAARKHSETDRVIYICRNAYIHSRPSLTLFYLFQLVK